MLFWSGIVSARAAGGGNAGWVNDFGLDRWFHETNRAPDCPNDYIILQNVLLDITDHQRPCFSSAACSFQACSKVIVCPESISFMRSSRSSFAAGLLPRSLCRR